MVTISAEVASDFSFWAHWAPLEFSKFSFSGRTLRCPSGEDQRAGEGGGGEGGGGAVAGGAAGREDRGPPEPQGQDQRAPRSGECPLRRWPPVRSGDNHLLSTVVVILPHWLMLGSNYTASETYICTAINYTPYIRFRSCIYIYIYLTEYLYGQMYYMDIHISPYKYMGEKLPHMYTDTAM